MILTIIKEPTSYTFFFLHNSRTTNNSPSVGSLCGVIYDKNILRVMEYNNIFLIFFLVHYIFAHRFVLHVFALCPLYYTYIGTIRFYYVQWKCYLHVRNLIRTSRIEPIYKNIYRWPEVKIRIDHFFFFFSLYTRICIVRLCYKRDGFW